MTHKTTKLVSAHSTSVVGIDEAGRGPLAGPVAIGAVLINPNFRKKFLKGIKDSKQLSQEERELWYSLAIEAKKVGDLNFSVSLVSAEVIDKRGISYAISLGIKRCLLKLEVPLRAKIFLDGGIKAPSEFKHQLTVIRGDEKIPIIALASILAKVARDRLMIKKSKEFPEYGFHLHKGYGTFMHRIALKLYGPSSLHRLSFLKKIDTKKIKYKKLSK